MDILQACDLKKTYGTGEACVHALDGVSLNVEKGEEERLNKLYVLEGSKPYEVPELHAGDIGAIAKLNSVQTGDSLAAKPAPVLYPKAVISTPNTCKRYKAV